MRRFSTYIIQNMRKEVCISISNTHTQRLLEFLKELSGENRNTKEKAI